MNGSQARGTFYTLIVVLALLAQQPVGAYDFGLRLVRFRVNSDLVGQTLEQIAIVPHGQSSETRPLLVFLHGRDASPQEMLSEELYSALEDEGGRAPVVLLVNGGQSSYFHDRATGLWGSYVMREVIPQGKALLGIDGSRVALGGISMGGFGALDLGRLHPGAWCAIGAHSPAIFRSPDETSPASFDNPDDFFEHDLLAIIGRIPNSYGHVPIWIDIGRSDPFEDEAEELAMLIRARSTSTQFKVWAGGHDQSYWRRHFDSYIRFYTSALSACEASSTGST